MKVYTVQFAKGSWLGTKAQPVTLEHWNSNSAYRVKTVGSRDEARHYQKKGQAQAYINRTIDRLNKEMYKLQNGQHTSWYRRNVPSFISSCQTLLNRFEGAWVGEYECEKEDSNLPSVRRKQIKFDPFIRQYSGHNVWTPTNTRKKCKLCGVVLKGIPTLTLTYGNGTDICAFCVEEMTGETQTALKNMDQDFRKEVEQARFLERM